MNENETPSATGEMSTADSPVMGTPPATGEMSGTEQPQTQNDTQELERLRVALKKANADASSHRKKADELDKLKADQEAASLSETQKLQKQLAKLQADHDQAVQTAKDLRIRSAIQVQAIQQGIDPTLASKLIDQAAIEFGDTGDPTNVADLLKSLVKQYPNLVAKQAATTSGGATNPPRSQSDGSGEITEQYVADVTSGRIAWQSLSTERRQAVLNWQAQNMYNFKTRR